MRPLRTPILAVCLTVALAIGPGVEAAEGLAVAPLAATARRAGLRLLESDHLVLATDRPVRAGDGVDDLPRIFDEAFVCWCGHYGIEPAAVRDWRAFGCLVVDRERFRTAGLLPRRFPTSPTGSATATAFGSSTSQTPIIGGISSSTRAATPSR